MPENIFTSPLVGYGTHAGWDFRDCVGSRDRMVQMAPALFHPVYVVVPMLKWCVENLGTIPRHTDKDYEHYPVARVRQPSAAFPAGVEIYENRRVVDARVQSEVGPSTALARAMWLYWPELYRVGDAPRGLVKGHPGYHWSVDHREDGSCAVTFRAFTVDGQVKPAYVIDDCPLDDLADYLTAPAQISRMDDI